MSTSFTSPLLSDVLPELARELGELLKEQRELGLAAQVPELRVVDRSRGRDDFRATFWTEAKPQGS